MDELGILRNFLFVEIPLLIRIDLHKMKKLGETIDVKSIYLMKTIKPIKITSKLTDHPVEKLTSAEMGKLWAVYMGNTMSKCVISYYLQHVNDKDIKEILKNAQI